MRFSEFLPFSDRLFRGNDNYQVTLPKFQWHSLCNYHRQRCSNDLTTLLEMTETTVFSDNESACMTHLRSVSILTSKVTPRSTAYNAVCTPLDTECAINAHFSDNRYNSAPTAHIRIKYNRFHLIDDHVGDFSTFL